MARALAGDVAIVPERGPVHPGHAVILHIVATDDLDQPTAVLGVSAASGRIELLAATPGDTSRRARWIPPETTGEARFQVQTAAGSTERTVDVLPAPPAPFALPDRADAIDGRPISLRVEGDAPLRPESARVYVSEPADVAIIAERAGGRVEVRPSGEGARSLLVALVIDGHPPTVSTTRVSVVARPTLSFDLEPSARLTVRIGGRQYGPARPGPDGRARLTIDQRPGETTADLTVADALGNALTSPYVLSSRSAGPLLVAPAGRTSGPGLPPELLVMAARPGGSWLVAPAPSCRAGSTPVDVRAHSVGAWWIELPPLPLPGEGLRVQCETPEGRGERLIVLPGGHPATLDLSVLPDVVDADAPRADVAVYVLDERGERIAADEVSLAPRYGELVPAAAAGPGLRASYIANERAAQIGQDVLTASLDLPRAVGGTPVFVEIGVGPRGAGGATVVAIPRDEAGRAIPDVPLNLGLPGRLSAVRTNAEGRAVVELDATPPIVVGLARLDGSATAWGFAATPAAGWRGPRPDSPDLQAQARIAVLPGRVASVRIDPEERLVLSGEGASTGIRVGLFDRTGARVSDVVPTVEVSAGSVEPPRVQPDGAWWVVLRPPADGRSRVITLRASSPSGDASAAVELRVEPRPVLLAVGLSAGASTNLGALASPILGVDLDLGLPGRIRGAMLRVGVATLSYSRTTNSEFGEVRNQTTLLPVTLAAMIRRRSGPFSVHGGVGALIVPFRAESRFGSVRRPPRAGLTPPGFAGILGAGRRAGPGELAIEARANLIYSQGTVSGFAGQVGGISALLSYRLLID